MYISLHKTLLGVRVRTKLFYVFCKKAEKYILKATSSPQQLSAFLHTLCAMLSASVLLSLFPIHTVFSKAKFKGHFFALQRLH